MSLFIDYKELTDTALVGLIESFILREGTDYGLEEQAMNTKIAQLKSQLARGEILVVYDEVTESANLLKKEDALQQSINPE